MKEANRIITFQENFSNTKDPAEKFDTAINILGLDNIYGMEASNANGFD